MQYQAALEPAEGCPEAAPWTIRDMLTSIGIVIVGMLAALVPSAVLAAALAEDTNDIESDPEALTVVLSVSFILELLLLGTAVHFSVRKYGAPWRALGLRWPDRAGWWLPGALVMAGLGIVYVYFATLSAFGVEPEADIPEEAFDNLGPLIVLAVLSLAFAPLMEEVFFRGFIFGGLRARWGVRWAALGSGFLFALAHIGNPGTFYILPPITLVGALFAWGYVYSGSIMPPVAAHFLFNLFSFSVGLAQA
jgi:hypothetical protein